MGTTIGACMETEDTHQKYALFPVPKYNHTILIQDLDDAEESVGFFSSGAAQGPL